MAAKSKFFESLASMVASGESISSAAESIGAANSTAYRIAKTPEFKNRVNAIRTEFVSDAIGKLSAAASRVVVSMIALLGCDDHGIRLRAAVGILDRFSKLSESLDLRVRVEALEEQIRQG